ncbi:type II CAAX prenyl endopeptidase Rce1 family protein [Gryllotalpicola reticulitermitis]|uniref:Type II CAAX prenyl endopeptidase Rce1 family protein n=1 Tax=Gryllotalpicola reticulitermitis TaxID=1184153 RepID=A0ABV8Q7V2_9MICO
MRLFSYLTTFLLLQWLVEELVGAGSWALHSLGIAVSALAAFRIALVGRARQVRGTVAFARRLGCAAAVLVVAAAASAAVAATLGDATLFLPNIAQSIAEELAFRVLPVVLLVRLATRTWVAWAWLCVTSVVFALAHGATDWVLLGDKLVFALGASALVWRYRMCLPAALLLASALHIASNAGAAALYASATHPAEWLIVADLIGLAGALVIARRRDERKDYGDVDD